MEYNLNLTEQEVNKILEVLSKRPFDEVFTIVGKVREQAVRQENKLRLESEKQEEEFMLWKEEKETQEKEDEEYFDPTAPRNQ